MEKRNINPWLHLWTQPRASLRFILNNYPKKLILWLSIMGGIISLLAFAAYSWFPPRTLLHSIFLITVLIIIGGIFGLLHLYFSGWLLKITGSWIGGKGDFNNVKCAVGWSNYPFIISNIFSILSVFSNHNIWLKTFFTLINLIITIWGVIMFMKMIGEAHQFSIWKAILAFLIAAAFILIALTLIALLIPLLSPLFQ